MGRQGPLQRSATLFETLRHVIWDAKARPIQIEVPPRGVKQLGELKLRGLGIRPCMPPEGRDCLEKALVLRQLELPVLIENIQHAARAARGRKLPQIVSGAGEIIHILHTAHQAYTVRLQSRLVVHSVVQVARDHHDLKGSVLLHWTYHAILHERPVQLLPCASHLLRREDVRDDHHALSRNKIA